MSTDEITDQQRPEQARTEAGRASEPLPIAQNGEGFGVKAPNGAERWYPSAVFSVTAAGKALGLKRSSAYLWVKDGRLPTVTLADGRVIVTAYALDRLLYRAEYPEQTDEEREHERAVYTSLPPTFEPPTYANAVGAAVARTEPEAEKAKAKPATSANLSDSPFADPDDPVPWPVACPPPEDYVPDDQRGQIRYFPYA